MAVVLPLGGFPRVRQIREFPHGNLLFQRKHFLPCNFWFFSGSFPQAFFWCRHNRPRRSVHVPALMGTSALLLPPLGWLRLRFHTAPMVAGFHTAPFPYCPLVVFEFGHVLPPGFSLFWFTI